MSGYYVFKRDPGFLGIVMNGEGAPVAGVKVQIYGPDGKLLAKVYTDEDGWYFYNYARALQRWMVDMCMRCNRE